MMLQKSLFAAQKDRATHSSCLMRFKKNHFRMLIWDLKSIEIHLKHYEIPQPSARYQIPLRSNSVRTSPVLKTNCAYDTNPTNSITNIQCMHIYWSELMKLSLNLNAILFGVKLWCKNEVWV